MPVRYMIAWFSAVALLLTGCGVGQGSTPAIGADAPVKVGVVPIADYAPFYIALDEGYFEQAGLNIQIQVMQNAASIVPSVINGQLQFGTSAVTPIISAKEKGLPVKAVANSADVALTEAEDISALVVPEGSAVKRPAELEGRTVAVNAMSSILHIAAAKSIKSDGGDPDKVTFVAMPLPDMMTALKQGRVDAASVIEPFVTVGESIGARTIAHPFTDSMQAGGTYATFFTAEPFAEKNPELVHKFVEALAQGSRVATEHPEKVQAVLVKYGNLDPELAKKMKQPRFETVLDPESIQSASDLMHELGVIPRPFNGADLLWR